MRTNRHLLCLLAFLGTMAACEGPGSGEQTAEQTIVFTGYAPQLKSVIASDGTSMYWSEYDNVAAYLFEDGEFRLSDLCKTEFTSVSMKSASYYPQEKKYVSDWAAAVSNPDSAKFYAVAPAQDSIPVPEGTSISLKVPSLQVDDYGPYQIALASEAKFGQVVTLQFTPVTSIFSVRCHLSADSPFAATKIVKMDLKFDGAAVVGDCVLDMAEGVLTASTQASDSEVTVKLTEPSIVSGVLEGDKPSHFNSYIRCAVIPSKEVSQVSVTIYDKDGNSFEAKSPVLLSESGLIAGSEFKCDCVFYVDKVSMSDTVSGEGDEGFEQDWEVEL